MALEEGVLPTRPRCTQLARSRWRWLIVEFGEGVLLDLLEVLPTSEFFSDRFDASDGAAETMGRRICDFMQVPADLVDFEFYTDRRAIGLVDRQGLALGGVAGTFQCGSRYRIRIERSQILEPMTLAGTLAHELSHARLLGENRIESDSFDHELTTDLNVVFHGMGIFLANVPRHWDGDTRCWPETEQLAPTYMTGPMLAFALALRSCQRMESLAPWRKHLKPAIRAEFTQAYRFLAQ